MEHSQDMFLDTPKASSRNGQSKGRGTDIRNTVISPMARV